MQKVRWLSFILVGILLVVALPASAQDSFEFEFEPSDCPVDMPTGFSEGDGLLQIECGFVEVPEFHAEPDGNTIRVAVAVMHGGGGSDAVPVYMEQGGPGGSTIDLFVQFAPLFANGILLDRDIILVEQRGTLYSEPYLGCPEITDLTIDILDDDLETTEVIALEVEAYQACFDRLTDEGVNLSAFNSVENASDIVAVADALGHDEINFYGVSYGTMLGQHLLRDYEDRVNAIILDAVVPLELNFLPDVLATGSEAIRTVFEACEADEFCNELYPELETTFFETYAELNENPVTFQTIDPETGTEYDVLFNGDSLFGMLRSMQYQTEFVGSLPYFIQAASEGEFTWAERLAGLLFIDAGRSISDGMYTSVICAEDADFTIEDITTEGVYEELLGNNIAMLAEFSALCTLGNIEALDSYVDDPVLSDVPALLMSGEFDPITPPRYGDVVAENLSNSTHLVFNGVGHGAILSGACGIGIVRDFLNNPEAPVDSDCLEDLGIRFSDYTSDPSERLIFPIPNDMDDISTDEYAYFTNGSIDVGVIAIDETDVDVAIQSALDAIVEEGFDRPALLEQTLEDSFGEVTQAFYQDGANYVVTIARVEGEFTSVIVMVFSPLQLNNVDPILATLATNLIAVRD